METGIPGFLFDGDQSEEEKKKERKPFFPKLDDKESAQLRPPKEIDKKEDK
ncbi:hypothetical protein [Candidatus Nitronereus thalassa]|uniref:Uncharacterized protein n=1 Tax=Candidatus Nitronereus thalassa TaxID=3020898 RepID=A0ABU3K5W8_9BACT|nr:hypothetical protein [Candidatus Nitronereus thalassa]MDT7041738.1 hypothetical protein [Candidatus Nitronereus thalassa]